MGFKAIYSDQWDKAAKNCEQVKGDLLAGFTKDGLTLREGHAATDNELDNSEHESGEPDLFLIYNDNIIGAVEVTGSDRVNWPCEVWIGAHKMRYARKVFFPVCFILFYPNETRFVSRVMVDAYAPTFETRTVYGGIEHYHVLKPRHTRPYSDLVFFVDGLLDFAKREAHQKEVSLDEHRGLPWE